MPTSNRRASCANFVANLRLQGEKEKVGKHCINGQYAGYVDNMQDEELLKNCCNNFHVIYLLQRFQNLLQSSSLRISERSIVITWSRFSRAVFKCSPTTQLKFASTPHALCVPSCIYVACVNLLENCGQCTSLRSYASLLNPRASRNVCKDATT